MGRCGFSYIVLMSLASTCHAFPPYRSTDADTAGRGTVEFRLGLLRIQRQNSASERTTPLTRANFGVGDHFEVVSEFEYSPSRDGLEEGALGIKWARRDLGIGVETLALLPVQGEHSGTGLESQLIKTFERQRWQLHLNVGGFYDPRASATERGWRGSILAEFPRRRIRPGTELFAKKVRGEGARIQVGAGIIAQMSRLQVRTALHFGLTREAPDVEASVWFAWSWDTTARRGK